MSMTGMILDFANTNPATSNVVDAGFILRTPVGPLCFHTIPTREVPDVHASSVTQTPCRVMWTLTGPN